MSNYEEVENEFDLTYEVFCISDSLGIKFRDLTLWIGAKVEALLLKLNKMAVA